MSIVETPSLGVERCAICGELAATETTQTQQFAYRDGDQDVLLTATMPVISCASCGETYTGMEAEEAQHAAVCLYLGRLAPSEIRDLRSRKGWSQAKLAEKSGIGIASIKRWETGALIQNASLDARLRHVFDAAVAARPTPRWQTELKPEMHEAAKIFRLRQPLMLQAAVA